MLDNDTRGWLMTAISGLACVLGASIICIDFVVRLFPRMHNFSIAESDAFLSASLSLSFGVMLFSSLYSMLPKSKTYLHEGGYSARGASYILIGLFLAGVLAIRVLSSVLHRFIPSHVVDCDHSHDEESALDGHEEMSEHSPHDEHTNAYPVVKISPVQEEEADEDTPLLSRTTSGPTIGPRKSSLTDDVSKMPNGPNGSVAALPTKRPSLLPKSITRTFTEYVVGKKEKCDEGGPCMGYTNPCGQDCFNTIYRRSSILPGHRASTRNQTWRTLSNGYRFDTPVADGNARASHGNDANSRRSSAGLAPPAITRTRSSTHHFHHPEHEHPEHPGDNEGANSDEGPTEHHHHVPTNAFMAIGLQTSIAIALHKAPEGFITYATNHANPTLGFAVFMALFIHNITEGFAMSLPLYLALNSRWKAIILSSFLGGLSQPLGAGVAALWFKLAKSHGGGAPSEAVYGSMFAVTAGVMTSVALSLFSESLQLSHNKGTCILFAFLGMGILGVSFALTAE